MAQIKVVVQRAVPGTPEQVVAKLADYQGARARSWPQNVSEYRVLAGGTGAGSRIAYRLQATRKRVRQVDATVSAPDPTTLVEADQNSSLQTRWQVWPPVPASNRALSRRLPPGTAPAGSAASSSAPSPRSAFAG